MRKFAGICFFTLALIAGLTWMNDLNWARVGVVVVLLVAAIQAFEFGSGGWAYEAVRDLFGAAVSLAFAAVVLVATYLWLEPRLQENARIRASNKAFAQAGERCRKLVDDGKYPIGNDGDNHAMRRALTIGRCALKMTEASSQP